MTFIFGKQEQALLYNHLIPFIFGTRTKNNLTRKTESAVLVTLIWSSHHHHHHHLHHHCYYYQPCFGIIITNISSNANNIWNFNDDINVEKHTLQQISNEQITLEKGLDQNAPNSEISTHQCFL